MAENTQKTAEKAADQAKAEAQKAVDTAEEQGFIGTKVDPRPNSDYSLESGPDSPSAAEQRLDVARADIEAAENSTR